MAGRGCRGRTFPSAAPQHTSASAETSCFCPLKRNRARRAIGAARGMAQSVVYADLKFAAGPPSTVPDEDDSPYENVPLGPVTAAPSPGRWTRRWRVPRALLAASLLLLLLVVAVVVLGAYYWQVTRSLQDTSREHMAEQGRLSQELRAREQSLEQTQLELAWAREELQRVWHEYNITQMELESRNAELGHTQQELAVLQEEVQVVQGKLNTSKSLVSSLRACVNTDCCPSGWVLYRSKCLYISMAKKNWQDSHQDCAERSAQLLVQDDWSSLLVPLFVQASNARYWIGTRIFYEAGSSVRRDSKYPKRYNSDCWSVGNGELWSLTCKNLFQWICEKSPNLSSASETRPPFLTKD
ncbi:B-cell differentiation antigen CD72-like [Corvus hawaiiensis]|uniref:B-cell differentiation antigen CD72-like n=1 Tax=Corvus hawaiiensis TaxID=134902 RepID=UPI002018473D|nr:B-cell differentiation antigen CD72-like [Corvus hawaiiensis]